MFKKILKRIETIQSCATDENKSNQGLVYDYQRLDDIRSTAMDMKFHYDTLTESQLEKILSAIDTAQNVIRENMTGDTFIRMTQIEIDRGSQFNAFIDDLKAEKNKSA